MKVSIVIPAHNEEKRIAKTLESYGNYFNKQTKLNYEILVVINATTDNTLKIVNKFRKKNSKIKLINIKEGGKGLAVIDGFNSALNRNFDLIGFVDADSATPPQAFYDLIVKIRDYDGVIAGRWLKESIIKTKQTLLRRITSRAFNFIVRSLFLMKYRDTQCGAKLFRSKVLKEIVNEIGLTQWAFDVDLLYQAKKKGFNIKEVPTIWEDKKEGKLNLIKVPFMMFTGVLRLRLVNSPFNFIVRAYDTLPDILKIHHKLK